MDEYKLAIDALVKSPRIEITEYAYDEIEKSCEALRIALRIEERYEIFLRNFIDLEKELLSISLKNMISSECSYFKCSEERISLNQRIINLLSSSRSYLEQSIKYDVACVLGESGKKLYTKIVYKLKIESNSFNFIEELRNHIQHNGLPVDTYSINRSWDEGFKHLETSCRITADKGKLAEDGDWEKRKALDPMPEKIGRAHV